MWTIALQSNLVPGQSLREKIARVAELGYGGIEITGKELLQNAEVLQQAMGEFNVRVTSACAGFEGWLVDPDPWARRTAIDQIKEMTAVGAELGTAGLISPAAYGIGSRVLPDRGKLSVTEGRALLVEGLREIAESAARTGGTLLLEPLNRYADLVLNTVAEGVSVIDEVGSRHIRLIPDTFHMNIEEASLPDSLRQYAAYISHIHLSDSNRLLPGQGHIDFAALFATLKSTGYEGAFAIECMLNGPPMELLPQTRDFLRRAGGM